MGFPSENRLTWQGQRASTCPMDSTDNLADRASNSRSRPESGHRTLSNVRTVVGRHADGTEERWEVKALGCGMVVIGNPESGYLLHRKPGERTVPLVGKTMLEAYRNAAMGVMYEKDWDALFRRHPEPIERKDRLGKVYFIAGEVGAVKIGFAANPELRVKDLQCGSPIPLHILATIDGAEKDERAYHQRFKAHRLHGEWFERCPEIEAEIDRLRLNPSSQESR
jgi:hypothetical protein